MAKGERDGSAEVRSPYLHHNFALDGSYVHHGGVFVLPVKRWLRARNTQPARRRVQHRAHTLAGLSRAAHVMDTASALVRSFPRRRKWEAASKGARAGEETRS
jgi:hypothetical protein